MTAPAAGDRIRRLDPGDAGRLAVLLETDWGAARPGTPASAGAALASQYLLDALDRGHHDRFLVWPGDDPVGLIYAGPTGTLVPSGDAAAAPALSDAAERLGWRVMVGDARLGWALLDVAARGLFRRRVNAREQRLMAVEPGDVPGPGPLAFDGVRLARDDDLDALVDYACRLHVEDLMGPPIARSARSSVRARMRDSVVRGATYVVERDGRPVAKADLSLRSPRRGAQIAGVYVAEDARGQGIASGLVGTLARMLLDEGLPGASLHVRSDNAPAIAAYRRAGLTDRAPWVLALR